MSAQATPQPLGKATRPHRTKASPYADQAQARNAAIYVRVSMEEQAEGHSLEEQERRCRDFIAKEKPHWTLTKVLAETHSGKTDRRPKFKELLRLIDDGQIDAVVCHHLDRFSRKLHDVLVYFKQFEEQNVVLAFADDRFDFTTPNGMLEFHILAVFADWYLQNLAREVSKGKLGRVLKGEHNNQLPFGYLKTPDGKLAIVPDEGAALREAFEGYAAGQLTDRQIAELFNARQLRTRGGKLWSKDAVRDIMQNDFYYGVVEYRTDLYQGNHPPLITKDLFDEALKTRREHRRAPRTNSPKLRTYVLNGLLYCDTCQRSMRAQGSRQYRYYRDVSHLRGYDDCSHAGEGVQCYIIEDQVGQIVQAFQLPADWQTAILRVLNNEEERTQILAQRRKLEGKKMRLAELYAEGSLDRSQFDKQREEIRKELDRLVLPSADRTITIGNQIETFAHIWAAANLDEQREICHLMFERIDVDLGTHQVTRVVPDEEFLWFFQHNPLLEDDGGLGLRVRPGVLTAAAKPASEL